MQNFMTLEQLLTEVQRQTSVKKDFIASTEDQVIMTYDHVRNGLFIDMLGEGRERLERFSISENAHRQISARLGIPWKYYERLVQDHPDLVRDNVNTLFKREPQCRMFRALDGEVRAFLSDRYLRLDNREVLENTLPTIVKGGFDTTLLASHVDAHNMSLKVLFQDDNLAHEVARARGEPRVIRPGFRLSNSETGGGALKLDAFFFDSYCTNGCVFGKNEMFDFSFKRTHLGGKLAADANLNIVSDETRKLEDQYIISQINDVMLSLSNPGNIQKMADVIRSAAKTDPVQKPISAVVLAASNFNLRDNEKESMLETFLRDGDYTKFGLSSALTEVANNESIADANRVNDLEEIGSRILNLNPSQWKTYIEADLKAA